MIKLEPLKCPKCGSVLKSQQKDLVYRCENCGTFVYAPTMEVLNAKIYRFDTNRHDKKYYMPFFVYRVEYFIRREVSKHARDIYNQRGSWIAHIPAGGSLPAHETLRIAKLITSRPPQNVVETVDFEGIPNLPVEITVEEGERMSEFLFLSYEVDKPGILQSIAYTFTAKFIELIYLPFYYRGYYYPGLVQYGGEGV